MARHSEEECAYCEDDVLPLSYIVGADDQLYCSVKCADAGERRSITEPMQQQRMATKADAGATHA